MHDRVNLFTMQYILSIYQMRAHDAWSIINLDDDETVLEQGCETAKNIWRVLRPHFLFNGCDAVADYYGARMDSVEKSVERRDPREFASSVRGMVEAIAYE